MNCAYCQATIDDDAKFCPSCGTKTDSTMNADGTTTTPPLSTPSFTLSADREGSGGVRGQQQQNGKTRYYYGKAAHARETVQVVERFLFSENLQTQIIETGHEVVIQGKQRPNIFKKALGLDQAVTVGLSIEGNDMRVTIGGARSLDKAAGAAIAWFIAWPALLTTGWGVYKQTNLFTRIEKEIDSFLASK